MGSGAKDSRRHYASGSTECKTMLRFYFGRSCLTHFIRRHNDSRQLLYLHNRGPSQNLKQPSKQSWKPSWSDHLPFKYYSSTKLFILQNESLLTEKRCFSTSSHVKKREKNKISDPDYLPIYRFRYIVPFKTASRAKIYQTVLTFAALPFVFKGYTTGSLSAEVTMSFLCVSTLAITMLYVFSIYIRRTVGIISFNEKWDTLRISHLTFWGKRNDVYLSVDKIVPFADASEYSKNIYQIIKVYDSQDKWYLFSRHGNLYIKPKMEKIFGRIE